MYRFSLRSATVLPERRILYLLGITYSDEWCLLVVSAYEMCVWGIEPREEKWVVLNGVCEGTLWCVESWRERVLGRKARSVWEGSCQVMFGVEGGVIV